METGLIEQNRSMPATLLEKAIDRGTDLTQLKELMDLQERWEKKEAKKSFLDALSRFQTIVPALKKTKRATVTMKTGGQFSYNYSDLGTIGSIIKNAMSECGLSYRWEFSEIAGKLKVTCLVSHRDGHTEATSMEGGMDDSGAKNAIQQKGSTHTYLQRYTLIGALGLTTADDDKDGKSSKPAKEKQEPTDEEIFDQWKQAVTAVRSEIELTSLYLKNRKAVDALPNVLALFSTRKGQLKSVNPVNAEMP